MATISNTPRPGYVWDSTDNVWYPIGVGGHSHPDYITQATAVNPTLIDAKGDIITATAADTPARLAVGNNGETLVADSSTSTGLRYTGNYAAGKNAIINGAFDVWQRGTSISLTNATYAYTADRWAVYSAFSAGTSSYSRQTFTPGAAPVAGYEGQYFGRLTCGSTASYIQIEQRIENVQTFAGQTVTLSFWAKASTAITLATFASQTFGTGGSSTVTTYGTSANITTSWVRYSTTIAVPSISGKTVGASSYLTIALGSSASLNGATIDLWGVQVEAGSVATAFQTATGTIQGELAACQRYFQKNFNQTTTPADGAQIGQSANAAYYATDTLRTPIAFPTMRTAPSITYFRGDNATAGVYGYYSGGWLSATSMATNDITDCSLNINTVKSSAGLTLNNIYMITGRYTLSAEL